MVKILQINSYANWGSTGKIAEQIGSAVMAQGWESYIAYGRQRILTPSTSHTIRIGNDLDVRIHGVVSRLFDKHGLASKKATRQFIKWVESTAPDLIHLHNIHGYYLNYEILFEYLAKVDIPVVWTLHDCWPFTGHCPHFDYVKCEYWKSGCRDCVQKRGFPTSWFVDNSKANYALKKKLFTSLGSRLTLVPVSEWLASVLRESFFSDSRIQVIYNGVDTHVFQFTDQCRLREKYQIGNKKVVLGVALPWTARKGFEDYIRLRAILPDDYVLMMVGVSQQQIKMLPPGIIGICRTQNQAELAEYYSMADIVLSLSREETFGMTIAEGLACGTPAVVYNCTATPELVTPATGLVVEPGNIEQLASAINKITGNGRTYYAAACRNHAIERFDKNDRFAEYIGLYKNLLKD